MRKVRFVARIKPRAQAPEQFGGHRIAVDCTYRFAKARCNNR